MVTPRLIARAIMTFPRAHRHREHASELLKAASSEIYRQIDPPVDAAY